VIRFLINTLMFWLAALIGLLVADVLLDGFSLDGLSLITASAIFAVIQAVLQPFLAKTARRNAPALLGGIGLVTALVSLFVTNLIVSSMRIDGVSTWFLAALVIWLAGMIAALLLPLLFAKWLVTEARKD
jgi:uncharacterized membrane protein YvlD (DUF360 family)